MQLKQLFRLILPISTVALPGILWATPSQALIVQYTSETDFLNALNGATSFKDPFNDIINAASPPLTRTGNGLSVTYSAPPDGLFNTTGALSTSTTSNNLIATLGPGIYAAGGNFYMSNVDGNFQSFPGQTTSARASNGIDPLSILLNPTNSTSNFFGWISTTPLTVVTSTSGGTDPNRWNTLDNFIVATAPLPTVPAVPGPLPLAGALGAFAWSRRLRRRVAAGRSSQVN